MVSRYSVLAAALLAGGIGLATTARLAYSQPAGAAHGDIDEGKRLFQRANCMGCHKWHGAGGGGYGGDALSLRNTQLDKEQIVEVVNCGRPGTGMPSFARDAYQGHECYGGMTKKDLEGNPVPQPQVYLRPPEVNAVADYVIAHVKGKGDPTFAQCTEFFGEGSKVCNTYKQGGSQPGAGTSETPRQGG
jgi:hypothetical protein